MEDISKTIDESIKSMATLNHTVPKVIRVANDLNSSARDIVKIIQMDPVLTAKALKLVNSAYFGLKNTITSLGRAVVMLGLNTIRNLALSCSIISAFKFRSRHISSEQYWKYSVAVSVMCQLLAKESKQDTELSNEQFLLIGLVHNIGKAFLMQFYPVLFDQAIELAKTEKIPVEEAEKKVLGINHIEAGHRLALSWGLPEDVTDGILFYNQPKETKHLSTKILSVASHMVKLKKVGFSGDYIPHKLPGYIWDEIGVSEDNANEILNKRLFLELDLASQFIRT